MSWLGEFIRKILLRAVFVSMFLLLIGAMLITLSELFITARRAGCYGAAFVTNVFECASVPITLLEMLFREFGVAFCSIGLISLLYEMLIRKQLIDDYGNKLTEIVNPDTRKFGVISLFENRDDKTRRRRLTLPPTLIQE